MQTWSYNQFERFQKDITIIRSTGNIKLIRILTENIFQKKKKKNGKKKKKRKRKKIKGKNENLEGNKELFLT